MIHMDGCVLWDDRGEEHQMLSAVKRALPFDECRGIVVTVGLRAGEERMLQLDPRLFRKFPFSGFCRRFPGFHASLRQLPRIAPSRFVDEENVRSVFSFPQNHHGGAEAMSAAGEAAGVALVRCARGDGLILHTFRFYRRKVLAVSDIIATCPMNFPDQPRQPQQLGSWSTAITEWMEGLSFAERQILFARYLLRKCDGAEQKLGRMFGANAVSELQKKMDLLDKQLRGQCKEASIFLSTLWFYVAAWIPENIREEIRQQVQAVLDE